MKPDGDEEVTPMLRGLFGRRDQPKVAQEPTLDAAPLAPGSGGQLAQATPPTSSAAGAEQLIQTVKAFRAAMKDANSKAKAEEDASLADAKRKIANAQRLVKETGLGDAMCLLLRTVWHYPSWSKRPDFFKHGSPLLQDIEASEEKKTRGGEIMTVSFSYNGRRYTLIFEQSPSYTPDHDAGPLGKIVLKAGDELVLSLSAHRKKGEYAEYNDWNPRAVDGLQLGEWVTDIVELHEKLKADSEKRYRDLMAKLTRDQAQNLPE